MKKVLAVLAGVGLLAAVSVVGPTIAGTKNHGEGSVPCGDDGTLSWSPTALWPPNHKDVPVTFTYVDGDDSASLTVTMNPHNEIVDGEEINGTGNSPSATDSMGGTDPDDGDGVATVTGHARAERSGHKNDDGGRVYEFDYTAEDGGMTDGCSTEAGPNGDGLIIFVPHDCREGACQG